jgi:hypothetical protein
MDDGHQRLDGDAAAHLLSEVFASDVTVARTACASCGAAGGDGQPTSVHVPAIAWSGAPLEPVPASFDGRRARQWPLLAEPARIHMARDSGPRVIHVGTLL